MRTPLAALAFVLAFAPGPLFAGVTTRVSLRPGGTEGPGDDAYPRMTPDGRFVVFSGRGDLVPGGIAPFRAVFVHDRQTGTTSAVSPLDRFCQFGHISADGRFVIFELARPSGNFSVYLHDRQTGLLTYVSHALGGGVEDDDSYPGGISADGHFISWHSDSDDLVPNDTNDSDDIFVADRVTGAIARVSVASDGTQANATSYEPAISGDGRVVTFHSNATNLIADDTNNATDVFVHDRQTGTTTRVSVASDGTPANGSSSRPAISADGRFVAFASYASNLDPGAAAGQPQVFVHDRVTGATTLESAPPNGVASAGYARDASISPDGRFVGFASGASDLVPGDTNLVEDMFLRDRQTGRTIRVSVDSGGTQPTPFTFDVSNILARSAVTDAGTMAFASPATDLVTGDRNRRLDVFVYDNTCGNAVPDPGEQCDDGNPIDGDGCDRDCLVSLCTGGASVEAAQLTMTRLGAPVGDEQVRLKGKLRFPSGTPSFDPLHDGLELRLGDAGAPGTTLFELSRLTVPVPPGARGSACGRADGWTSSTAGFIYRNTSNAIDPPECTPGTARGLRGVTLKRGADGRVALAVTIAGASLAAPVGPPRVTLVLGGVAAGGAGACATGSLAAAACKPDATATAIACR